MGEKFEIEVPIDVKSKGGEASAPGGATDNKELKKLNEGVKKLDKTMFLNIDVIEILSSVLGDIFKILKPLFKLLSVMLLLVFLPLMPIYKQLIKGLAQVVKWLAKLTKPGGPAGFVQEKGKGTAAIIAGILTAVGGVILFAVGGWILVLLGAITAIIVVFLEDIASFFKSSWEDIVLPVYTWLGNQIVFVWEQILLPAWQWFSNVPKFIWNQIIKPAFRFLDNVGIKIWDIIRLGLSPIANLGSMIWGVIKSALGGLFGGSRGRASGGPVTRGEPFLVGEKGPEIFVPGSSGSIVPNNKMGGTTVNINNPSVRNDGDIKKLANEVSRVLQRQMTGRVSAAA